MSPAEKTKTTVDVKKALKAVLGPDLELDPDLEVAVSARVGTYTTPQGKTSSRHYYLRSRPVCHDTNLLDVSGVSRTGADGKAEFLLSEFHCLRTTPAFEGPVNFLATPRSRSPVFLTVMRAFTADRRDVKLTVRSWGPTGSPAPEICFDWRCRAPYAAVVT